MSLTETTEITTTETEEVVPSSTPTAAASPRVSLAELETNEDVGDHQHCLVCYTDLTDPGILPCNHNEICGVCHLRLRHLHGNNKCPICKEDNDKIVVDTPGKTFDEYPIWGDELGSNYIFQKNVGMFFEHVHYHAEIEPLFGFQCGLPDCPYDGTVPDVNIYEQAQEEFDAAKEGEGNNNNKKKPKNKKPPTPLRALQDHLRVKHRLTLCQLCIDHKRDFIARLPRFAPHQLKKHLTKGEPGSGFEGHPVCEFCRPKRFYDLTHLHLHLQKEHYKCHVCEKQGQTNQYFRNYQSLEKHFGKAHFLCPDNQCLQARFVVFENEIDLQAHERQVHGATTAGSSKIQLEFRTRRSGYDGAGMQQQSVPSEEDFNYGLQGEAFVPDALPQNNDLTLHPLHLQRTAEFRAHAAHIREQLEVENQGAAFPTLQAATAGTGGTEAGAGQQPLNIGWTSSQTVQRVAVRKKNAGAVTDTDFPALPSSGPAKSAATAKLRAQAKPQFAAMRAAAAQPIVSAPGGWGGSSRPAAAPSHQHNNNAAFPSMPSVNNRAENLTQDNFPALGGGKKKGPKYAATTNLSRMYQSNQQQPPSWNSAIDFPAAPSQKPAAAARVAPAPAPKKPPAINNEMHFPPPPSANKNNSVKQSLLAGNKKQPSRAAQSNVLQVPQSSAANPKDTLQDMQASLGPAKYKKLKKFTREFADDELDPDAFIDHAAALFDKGYGDPDFWKTIPSLVSSCPNQSSANEALRYMESLRTKFKASPAPTTTLTSLKAGTKPAAGNSWGSAPLDLTPESFPAPSLASSKAPPPGWGAGPSSAMTGTGGRNIPAGTRYVGPKKKGAWGGGAAPTVVQNNKAPVVSVASAAANEGPQVGTATKFMAKQAKEQKQQQQQQQQQNNNQGKKKNKKKEKDELRSLAFGR